MDEIPSRQRPRARKAAVSPLADSDLRVLAFAAEHRFFLGAHARTLLGLSTRSASSRLRKLTDAGWLRYERKLAGPGCYQITRRGLNLIGSSLPRPRAVDLATYDHEVGLGWLWLAAERGAFGALRSVASERHMRSEDRRRADAAERLGVRLPGVGPYGGERRHYPDLLLETASGHRVAVELELTPKSPARRGEILGGYALDGRIDAVLYLVETERAGRAIERSARVAGISGRVHVQLVQFTAGSGAIGAGRGTVSRSAREAGRDRHPAASKPRERAR
ncbi:MAG: hypothetical protein ABI323_01105 [Solirubrobacteraceae bacterium]